jgi:hypothetical protein
MSIKTDGRHPRQTVLVLTIEWLKAADIGSADT